MTQRANTHDLDKLRRWRQDLSESPSPRFPVYAMFLVSDVDRSAHDVFRRFRASFEEHGAGFGNLVIFGQHGVSTTVHLMLEQLGLHATALPLLALWQQSEFPQVWTIPLPAGQAEPGGSELARDALVPGRLLERVQDVATGELARLDASDVSGSRLTAAAGTEVLSWIAAAADAMGSPG